MAQRPDLSSFKDKLIFCNLLPDGYIKGLLKNFDECFIYIENREGIIRAINLSSIRDIKVDDRLARAEEFV